MALYLELAIAELLQDGDPAPDRQIDGLDTLRGWRISTDPDVSKRHIFMGEEPDAPDDTVTVVLEGGRAPIGGGGANAVGLRPSFTVRSRSESYEDAGELARQVSAILDYFQGTVNGVGLFRVFADFEPVPLGRDREDRGGRWIFSQSFRSVSKRIGL